MSDPHLKLKNSNNTIIDLIRYSNKFYVPLIMQSEVAECGLACLAMISSYYGHKINIPPLRRRFNLDTNGITLKRMMEISADLCLSTRAIKCSLEDVASLKTPCILHWDMQHFVVLTKVTPKYIHINDPAIGKRKLSKSEFSQSFTGVILELTPTASFKKKDVRLVMRLDQLWDKFIGLKRSLVTLFFLSLILQSTALLSPYYMQWVIDTVLISNDKPLLMVLAAGFFILIFIQTVVRAFRSWLVLRFSSLLNLQMGANLFHHLMRLPISYFEKRHIGDIVSRFGSLSAIRDLLTTGLVEALIDGGMALIVVAVMYFYSPKLTILVVSVMFLSFLIQWFFYYPNKKMMQESIIFDAKEDTIFLESIKSIQAIKLFSHEVNRQNTWLNSYAEVINANIQISKLKIAEISLGNIVNGVESILVVYFGALIVIDGELTIGMLLAFIAYKDQFSFNISSFIDNFFSFKMLSLHLERLSDITLENQEGLSYEVSSLPFEVKGSIRLENICYRYSDNSAWVIYGLNLEIKPGESVAIVGPSGSGKTTLLKIILGLIRPTIGDIFIDGVNVNKISLDTYRGVFGSVMQNDALFSGSIVENITMFDSSHNEERLVECCRLACILDDISRLPMGFYSLVGNMGNNFSGGQIQRLLLARALYRGPKILCLDESTSHLDTDNECIMNANMKSLPITRIIIAHRKETIESSDRVVKIEHIQKTSKQA